MLTEPDLRRSTESGFTLVEILTVIFIVGLTGSLVVFTMPTRSTPAERALALFKQDIQQASDRAVLSGRVHAIDLIEDGYQLKVWTDGNWVTSKRSQARRLDALDIRLRGRASDKDEARPELVFDPTGVNDQVELEFRARGERFILLVSPDGDVTHERR